MLKKAWQRVIRQARLVAVLTAITVVGGATGSYLTGTGHEEADRVASAPSVAEPAWGSEVLDGIQEHVIAGLPIRLANACGLGASSCFRCHNGKRAAAPGTDPEKNPWHVQHKTVNGSCAGCHQGNPRLMKQSIAHTGLVADPRTKPENSCLTCHTSGDAQSLVDAYQKL